jgi:zinc transport system substrate-binding protein
MAVIHFPTKGIVMDAKKVIIFGGIIALLIGALAFFFSVGTKEAKPSKITVSVSTFSLYEAARTVAGEALDIRTIIPLGSDAHMFSPTPKEVAAIGSSALFIYSGAGFEGWAEPLKNTLPASVGVLDMSRHVKLIESEAEHHDDEHEGEEEHQHGAYDPHYWLDIDNMILMTQKLEEEFSKLSPANADLFHKNAAAYVAELQKLKSEYVQGLRECKNRVLVSNHDAFGYLAHANKLENVSVIGLSSDEQPSAKNIADIVALVNEHGIKTVFFEALINDNVAQTIARETGARAVSLQPLENISEDELKSQETYLSIMRQNLHKLREAMECR